jgi:hypothetical protein
MGDRRTLAVTGGLMAGSFVLGALLVGSAVGVMAQDQSAPAGPTTQEVAPGVELILNDGAGHDLLAKHPDYPLDMDNVYVTPDGTVWVSSSYRDTDNDANGPGGGLVWAVGQPDTARYPAGPLCFRGTFDDPEITGVTCYDLVAGTETRYLAGIGINAVAPAPDGTFWAVGHGLYHITPQE